MNVVHGHSKRYESTGLCWCYPHRFQKGFIRAEVYRFDDIDELGSELAIKEAGRLRLEGKDYVVQDGDVMHFRFNV